MRSNVITALQSYVLIITLVFLGFGCGIKDDNKNETGKEVKKAGIPMLDIDSPDLSYETTDNDVLVKGTTDQDWVFVGNKIVNVSSGSFQTMITLAEGLNIIPVEAGNGFTTTTINLKITKYIYE